MVGGIPQLKCVRCGHSEPDESEEPTLRAEDFQDDLPTQRLLPPEVDTSEGPRVTGSFQVGDLRKVKKGSEPSFLGDLGDDDLPTDTQEGGPCSEVDDEEFDRQLAAMASLRRRRAILMAGVAVALVLMLAAIPTTFVVYKIVAAWVRPPVEVADGPDLNEVLADAERPAPEPAIEVDPEPVEEPEPEPEPEPDPEPEPEPAPKPTASRFDTLIAAGWSQAGSDPNKAAGTFQQALAIKPSHHEANYGYGYALLKQGDAAGATPHLCIAVGGPDGRDVRSLMKRNNLTCD